MTDVLPPNGWCPFTRPASGLRPFGFDHMARNAYQS